MKYPSCTLELFGNQMCCFNLVAHQPVIHHIGFAQFLTLSHFDSMAHVNVNTYHNLTDRPFRLLTFPELY